MAIKADQKYTGEVVSGSKLIESRTGSIGYQIMLVCEDGPTSFTLWLTPKAIEKAKKTLIDTLGVHETDLQSQAYLEFQLALDIVGKPVSFGTKEEEYNGKKTIKVSWIGKKSDPNLARGAATLFGATPAKQDTDPWGDAQPSESDEF
jgi:hypothetical protein